LSNLGLGLDYILMAMAPSLRWLFVARIISGITAASSAPRWRTWRTSRRVEKRAKSYGLIGMAFGVGFVLGPALVVLLGPPIRACRSGQRRLQSCQRRVSVTFVLPESLAPNDAARSTGAAPIRSVVEIPARTRELAGIAGAAFLSTPCHAVLPAVFVLYAGYRYGWDERAVGLPSQVVGASSVVVQGALVGPVVHRFGERRVLLAGLAAGALDS
jgi:DHA1 family tetracycline resistance protein-like MFS transporter